MGQSVGWDFNLPWQRLFSRELVDLYPPKISPVENPEVSENTAFKDKDHGKYGKGAGLW